MPAHPVTGLLGPRQRRCPSSSYQYCWTRTCRKISTCDSARSRTGGPHRGRTLRITRPCHPRGQRRKSPARTRNVQASTAGERGQQPPTNSTLALTGGDHQQHPCDRTARMTAPHALQVRPPRQVERFSGSLFALLHRERRCRD